MNLSKLIRFFSLLSICLIFFISILSFNCLVAKSAMAQGGLCIKIDPNADCPLTKQEFIRNQAEETAHSADLPDPRQASRSKNSQGSLGISGTYTSDYSVIAVPIGIPLGDFLTFDASVPYISIGDDGGIGHSYFGFTATYLNSSHTFGVSSSLGLRLPTGNPSVVGDRKAVDRSMAVSLLVGSKEQQVLATYQATFRPPDNLNQNLGDIRVFFVGYDRVISKLFGIYSSLTSSYTGDSTIEDRVLAGSSWILDGSLGVTIDFYDLRFGITTPLLSSNPPAENPEGESISGETQLEFGVKYDL